MTQSPVSDYQRLEELLADRAVQGLSPSETQELEGLLAKFPDADPDAFEYAAAALDLALFKTAFEPMPARLRESVESTAVSYLATHNRMQLVDTDAAPPQRTRGSSAPGRLYAPWLVAAASIVLAFVIALPNPEPPLRAQRDALMAQPNTVVVKWAVNDMGVTGDVVWNPEDQHGFLRFQGLGVNDPSDFQYQLWIFDAQRQLYSDFNAVDGGVFDVASSNEEIIIPIDAKLDVYKPQLFAVTTEPPGGVVKHNPEADPDRFKIILTAAPQTSG